MLAHIRHEMPRTKTKTPNRSQLKRAHEELRRLPAEQREELRYHGIGPGDSYVGMWRLLNRDRRRLERVEWETSELNQRVRSGEEMSKDERSDLLEKQKWLVEKDDFLSQRILSTYSKLLLHEKPRLQSVEVKGDQAGPLYHEVDLSRLSREDLLALARILPKLGGAPSEPMPEPKRVGHK
jgi:hypothetical protein